MEKDITPSEDDQIDYLAEILVEVYLESKGYKQYPWLNGEKRWRKEPTKPVENSDTQL